ARRLAARVLYPAIRRSGRGRAWRTTSRIPRLSSSIGTPLTGRLGHSQTTYQIAITEDGGDLSSIGRGMSKFCHSTEPCVDMRQNKNARRCFVIGRKVRRRERRPATARRNAAVLTRGSQEQAAYQMRDYLGDVDASSRAALLREMAPG